MEWGQANRSLITATASDERYEDEARRHAARRPAEESRDAHLVVSAGGRSPRRRSLLFRRSRHPAWLGVNGPGAAQSSVAAGLAGSVFPRFGGGEPAQLFDRVPARRRRSRRPPAHALGDPSAAPFRVRYPLVVVVVAKFETATRANFKGSAVRRRARRLFQFMTAADRALELGFGVHGFTLG